MTINEAIKHAEEVAEENENDAQIWHKLTKDRLDFCDKGVQAENNCLKCAEEHRQLAEWLKELKRLRKQTTWTPVSEGLPESEGLYFVSVKNDHSRQYSKTCWFNSHRNWFSRQDVIAWQPLPKPYKIEREE